MPQKLYVLMTDPRMPSKLNLWGTEPARSPEEASARFKDRVTRFYTSSQTGHLRRMDEDRERRLRENDFSVALAVEDE